MHCTGASLLISTGTAFALWLFMISSMTLVATCSNCLILEPANLILVRVPVAVLGVIEYSQNANANACFRLYYPQAIT